VPVPTPSSVFLSHSDAWMNFVCVLERASEGGRGREGEREREREKERERERKKKKEREASERESKIWLFVKREVEEPYTIV